MFEPANAALKHALALVPNLAEAHAGLGFSRFWFDFDWVGAEHAFRRGLTINPNTATAHWGLALLLLSQGRLADGFVHLRTARSLDPMSPVYNTVEASLLMANGQREEARIRLNRSLDISPDLWLTHLAAGLMHMSDARPEQGIASIRRAVALSDATTRSWSVLGVQLARLGETEEARSILNQLLTASKSRYVTPTSIASLHAALGEVGSALTALEQGVGAARHSNGVSERRCPLDGPALGATLCDAHASPQAGSLRTWSVADLTSTTTRRAAGSRPPAHGRGRPGSPRR